MTKPYNTSDLDPEGSFARHVFHRDQFAHYLRWSHVAREARHRLRDRPRVVDFGCGKGPLFEVMYRNRTWPSSYVGLDIREKTVADAQERFSGKKGNARFITQDLVKPTINLADLAGDLVCSFEVLEHVGKQNALTFLENLGTCGKPGATYFLSTPNYDERVGAAGNHTYDSGDGRGVAVQEHTHDEVETVVRAAGFEIERTFGTFASIRDYKDYLETDETAAEIFRRVREYYDSELVAVIMAPLVPARLARNCLWVLRRT